MVAWILFCPGDKSPQIAGLGVVAWSIIMSTIHSRPKVVGLPIRTQILLMTGSTCLRIFRRNASRFSSARELDLIKSECAGGVLVLNSLDRVGTVGGGRAGELLPNTLFQRQKSALFKPNRAGIAVSL